MPVRSKIQFYTAIKALKEHIMERLPKEKGNIMCIRPDDVGKSAFRYVASILMLYDIKYTIYKTTRRTIICVEKEEIKKLYMYDENSA